MNRVRAAGGVAALSAYSQGRNGVGLGRLALASQSRVPRAGPLVAAMSTRPASSDWHGDCEFDVSICIAAVSRVHEVLDKINGID